MTTGNANDTITKLMAELITPPMTIQGTTLQVDLSLCDKCTEDSLCALASLANGIVKLPTLDSVLPIAQSTKDGHTTHILEAVDIPSIPPGTVEPAVIIYCTEPKDQPNQTYHDVTVCGVGIVTQIAPNGETFSLEEPRLTPPILNIVKGKVSKDINPYDRGFVHTSTAHGP